MQKISIFPLLTKGDKSTWRPLERRQKRLLACSLQLTLPNCGKYISPRMSRAPPVSNSTQQKDKSPTADAYLNEISLLSNTNQYPNTNQKLSRAHMLNTVSFSYMFIPRNVTGLVFRLVNIVTQCDFLKLRSSLFFVGSCCGTAHVPSDQMCHKGTFSDWPFLDFIFMYLHMPAFFRPYIVISVYVPGHLFSLSVRSTIRW